MTNKMKITAVAALAAAVFCGSAVAQPAGSPVAKHGQLSVKDGRIVNKDGAPVALRGMSFYWDRDGWNGYQFYTAGAVNELASNWKVDIVRAAFSGTSGNATRIKTVVDAAVARGIYVIIDYHSHTANNEVSNAQGLFNSYISDPKVNYLYEIFNEPIGTEDYTANHQPYWDNTVKPYAETMVNYIRAKDKNNIILIGTPFYCLKLGAAANNPLTGANATNLAYVLHFYSAEHKTDKASPIAAAVNKGLAVYVSEFGTTMANGKDKYDTDEADKWFAILDQFSVGWCNWSVSAFEESSALTSGNADGTNWVTRAGSGTYIKAKLAQYATTRTITINKTGQGNVKTNMTSPYQYGSMVTLTAEPDAGWSFDGWSGAVSGIVPTATIGPLYENKTVTAMFVQGGNLISNGTFTSGAAGWTASGGTRTAENGECKMAVTSTGQAVSSASLDASGISLTGGEKYELTFRARAATAGKSIRVRATNSNMNREYMDPPKEFTLSTTMQSFTHTFDMCVRNSSSALINDASAVLSFECGGVGTWYIDDVVLKKAGNANCVSTAVVPLPAMGRQGAWSVAKSGSGWLLRGPTEAGGAVVSLYDTRGKAVRSAAAKDGLAINAAGLGAGSYLVVVRNAKGAEVYKGRVSLVR